MSDTPHPLRAPCRQCASLDGRVDRRNGQDCVFCAECWRFQYNAPRTEPGERPRTVETLHGSLTRRHRWRIIERASGRCELCGAPGELHVGHLVSVEKGLALGLTEAQLNDDENLAGLCQACNLGMGSEPVPLRLAVAMVLARIPT